LTGTADDLFSVVAGGPVKIEISQTCALMDAAQAHRDLAARKTTGSSVLLP
jgi:NADPH2:quinone reductase